MQDVGSVKDFRREEVRGFIHVHRPNEAHIVGYLNHACCLNHLFEIMMEMLPGIDKRFVVCCGKNVGREVEGKRVSAVIELAHEIELAKNGYRLQARILKTPDREPNWKALQSTLSRMQTLQQAIEALKKDRANALKETNRAKKDLEKCDFEIQWKIKEVSDLNKQMTAAKRELEILNKKRTFLGFEDTSSEEQRSNALGVKLTLMDIAERAHAALTTAGGIYSIDLIRDFTALLATQDLIVLSGSSGSGKTSLCREYARVTGSICHVIPVKPNWTSAEDLLGFYSPIEKRYLKTPFLNALLEASKDPSHLHIICLDEMNLARPEYYFADFLSVLETRSSNRLLELNMPEIDSRIRTRIHDVLNALPDAIALNADISTVLSDGSIKKALYDVRLQGANVNCLGVTRSRQLQRFAVDPGNNVSQPPEGIISLRVILLRNSTVNN